MPQRRMWPQQPYLLKEEGLRECGVQPLCACWCPVPLLDVGPPFSVPYDCGDFMGDETPHPPLFSCIACFSKAGWRVPSYCSFCFPSEANYIISNYKTNLLGLGHDHLTEEWQGRSKEKPRVNERIEWESKRNSWSTTVFLSSAISISCR